MTDPLESLARRLIDAAKKAGASDADATTYTDAAISIDVRSGTLEQAERAERTEIGLRVLVGQRQACVSASDLSDRTIAEMAERAVAMAREAPEDSSVGLADPSEMAKSWDLASLDLEDPTPDPDAAALERDARAAEAAALSVAGVSKVDSASASYGRRQVFLAGSNGFAGGYARTSRSISAVAISGEGLKMERDWAAESRTHQSDLPSAEEVGRRAGERAVERANPRQIKTGAYPVVYHERVAGSLIGHLLSATNGSSIVRGSSWLRDAMGTEVLPKGMSVTENPHRPRIWGSRPFDDEGMPTLVRDIVVDGVLKEWTLDLGTARRLGRKSTGSATRGISSPPYPAVSNIALSQGSSSLDDLLREIGSGLLVTSMIGSTINPTTGDYSRGASGFWVENGGIAWPVNEITIAGNLRDMLLRITPANDARTHLGMVVPSLLVEGLTLAGS